MKFIKKRPSNTILECRCAFCKPPMAERGGIYAVAAFVTLALFCIAVTIAGRWN